MKYESPAFRYLTLTTDALKTSDETDDEEYFGDQNKDFIGDGWHDLFG